MDLDCLDGCARSDDLSEEGLKYCELCRKKSRIIREPTLLEKKLKLSRKYLSRRKELNKF
jgi:hypothetical protein